MRSELLRKIMPEGMQLLLHREDYPQKVFPDGDFRQECYYEAEDLADVRYLAECGVDAKHIFLIIGKKREPDGSEDRQIGGGADCADTCCFDWLPAEESDTDGLMALYDKCRLVAYGREAFYALDRYLDGCMTDGRLLPVGIYLTPDKAHGRNAIPYDLSELRRLKNITVRGCFIEASYDCPQSFYDCYQAAKHLSAELPCAMPFMCFKGALTALYRAGVDSGISAGAWNGTAAPNGGAESDGGAGMPYAEAAIALETVAMQNETAFYALFTAD